MKRPPHQTVPTPVGDGTAIVPLTKGYVAIIDEIDIGVASQCAWQASVEGRSVYAKGRNGKSCIRLHREIMCPPAGFDIDHINSNGLDNRRCNLRLCSRQQNTFNQRKRRNATSKYRGVSWNSRRKHWHVQIRFNQKSLFIGNFANEEDAARAWDRVAVKLYGEFAKTNF